METAVASNLTEETKVLFNFGDTNWDASLEGSVRKALQMAWRFNLRIFHVTIRIINSHAASSTKKFVIRIFSGKAAV